MIAVGDIAGGEFDPLKGWGSRPAQIRPIHSSLLTIDSGVNFVGDLALVVADQVRRLGIEITAKGTTWDGIYLDGKANAVTWGGGRHHAHQLYGMYSSKVIDTGYNNMPQYANAAVDEQSSPRSPSPEGSPSCTRVNSSRWRRRPPSPATATA